MLALIFGMSFAGIESDRIDVGNSDTDGDRREQHQSNHQDYLHVASGFAFQSLELMCAATPRHTSSGAMPNLA